MDLADWIEVSIALAMLVLGTIFVWRLWRARSLARGQRAVEATVVGSAREESGSRSYSWFVITQFDVPGHGVLNHRRGFTSEGQAILWSRLHKEGTRHRVIPNAIETDQVFLLADLRRTDWPMIVAIAVIGGVLCCGIYATIVE